MSSKKNSGSRDSRQSNQTKIPNKTNNSSNKSTGLNKSSSKNSPKVERVTGPELDKPKGKKKLAFKTLKYLLYTLIVFGVILAGMALFILSSAYKDIGEVDINAIQNSLSRPSVVYDSKGNVIDKLKSSTSQIVVEHKDIPTDLINAVLAIEDTEFYTHNGFNLRRTLGALMYNFKVGYSAQGGSTITQQLAKNVYLTNEKTIDRKIKELVYSFIIEKKMSKDEILAAYLNTIYLGKGSYGVASASRNYFNKDLKDLTLAESALLAGMTKHPTKYDGYKALEISLDDNFKDIELVFYPLAREVSDADNKIYSKLLDNGRIDDITYKELTSGQKTVFKAVFNQESKKRQELVLSRMFEVGYINQEQYDDAKNAPITIDIPEEDRSEVTSYFVDYAKNEVLADLIKKGYTKDEAQHLLYNGGLHIHTTLDVDMQEKAEAEFENPKNFPYTKYESGIPQPQAAMVILEPGTGSVKAMVGGRGVQGYNLYNRAINPRQPGSSIKPLAVYLPAMIHNNVYPSTIVEDTPMYYKGKQYPNNYMHKYKGHITLNNAVKYSSNVVAARSLLSLAEKEKDALDISINFMEELGISTIVRKKDSPSQNDEHLPIVLGGMTHGVTPFDLAGAYGAIANGGVYVEPLVVTAVVDYTGKSLIENTAQKKQVFSPQVAYMMNSMLESVVDSGTGTRAELKNGMESAGKTGTTNGNKDGWFAGYTPYLVGVTWMGADIPREISGVSGRATSLWGKVMNSIHEDYKPKKFYENSEAKEVYICKDTGLLANKKDKKLNKAIKVKYLKDYIPTKSCTAHEYTEYDEWYDKKKEEEKLKEEAENNSSEDTSNEDSSSDSSSSNEDSDSEDTSSDNNSTDSSSEETDSADNQ